MQLTPKGFKKPTTGDSNDLFQFVGDNMDKLEVELDKKSNLKHTHAISDITSLQTELNKKETITGAQTKVNAHADDKTIHVTAEDKAKWNDKKLFHKEAVPPADKSLFWIDVSS